MRNAVLALAILGLLGAQPARSDAVDFTQLPAGNQGSGTVTVDGVTFQGSQGLFNTSNAHFPTAGGSVCSFDPAAFNCAGDLTVTFNGTVRRLKLSTAGFNDGDAITISVFRGATLVGTKDVQAEGRIKLRRFGGVTQLVITDSSTATTGAGFAYGKFKFRRPAATQSHPEGRAHPDGKAHPEGKTRRSATR